jgi:hypothetical protein
LLDPVYFVFMAVLVRFRFAWNPSRLMLSSGRRGKVCRDGLDIAAMGPAESGI